MKEFCIPSPPGQYRTVKFSQVFKNETEHLTNLTNTEPSVTLKPGEMVEIEWWPINNSGSWKLRRPS